MSRSKPPSDLGLAELRLALSIVEGSSLKVSGQKLIGRGSTPFRRLRDCGLIVRTGSTSSVACPECDSGHPVSVSFDHQRQEATAFCGEAGRFTVEPGALDVYEFDLSAFLEWIARALRISAKQSPIRWIGGHLWELGEVSIHHRLLRVMMARCIDSLAALGQIETIASRRTGKTGIVLTTSSGFTEPYRLHNGFSVISLTEVLKQDRSKAAIDLDRLIMISEPEATIDPFSRGVPGRRSGAQFVKTEHQRRVSSQEALTRIGEEARELEVWYAEHYPDGPSLKAESIENIIREAHNQSRLSYSSIK